MSDIMSIVLKAASNWNLPAGDPNLRDVLGLAREIMLDHPVPDLPKILPPKDRGLEIIGIVEERLIAGAVIRSRTPFELATMVDDTSWKLGHCGLIPSTQDERSRLAASLFAWHGCIWMAKLTRESYKGATPGPYTLELRLGGYYYLMHDWKTAVSSGNPWILYGVTLARHLALARKNVIVENWITSDSPYWQPRCDRCGVLPVTDLVDGLCNSCFHYAEANQPLYLCKNCGRHHWDGPKDCPA